MTNILMSSEFGDVLVDDDCATRSLLAQHEWKVYEHAKPGAPSRPYAVAHVGRTIYLHRLVMAAPEGVEVDHVNGNPLDNRRANLRLATRSQNAANRPSYRGSSRFKGVCRANTQSPRWRAWILFEGKSRYLGSYHSEDEAARAYDAAAYEQWGEFAHLNFPEVVH